MQIANVTTDPGKDDGITYARQQYNASLPATVPGPLNEAGEVTQVPNPDLSPSDSHYLMMRVASMVDSWYQQYEQSQAYVPPVTPGTINGVPQEVTRRQGIQALINTGMLALVQPAIDAITNPTLRATMQNEWDNSQTFQRQRPALISLATGSLGLTLQQLDGLFILAATL